MIEIVFSDTAAGGLSVASSSDPVSADFLEEEINKFGNNVPIRKIEQPEIIIPVNFLEGV